MTVNKIIGAQPYKQNGYVISAMPTAVYQSVNQEPFNPDLSRIRSESVKTAYVVVSTIGNNNIVSAISNKQIRVIGYQVSIHGANHVFFTSNGTQISSTMYANASGWTTVAPVDVDGDYFSTEVGQSLGINLNAAVPVGVTVQYIEY